MKYKIKLRLSTNQRQRVALYFLISLCQIAIYYIFKDQISKMNEVGLVYDPNSLAMLPLGIGLTSCFAWILPIRIDRFLSLLIWFIFLILVMPGCVMIYSLGFERVLPDFILCNALPIAAMNLPWMRGHYPKPGSVIAPYPHAIWILAIPTIMFGAYLAWTNANNLSLDFLDVYTRRLEQRGTANTLNGYLTANYYGAVLVVTIGYGLAFKHSLLTAISTLGFLLIFCIDGSKSALLIPVIMILVHLATKMKVLTPVYLLLYTLFFLLTSYGLNDHNINLYGVRRVFIDTPATNCWYFEYFSKYGFVFGKDMFISNFLYGTDPIPSAGLAIGTEYFDNVDSNANSNFLSSGFSQCGIFGAWLTFIIGCVSLKLYDIQLQKLPLELGQLIAIPIALRFCEQALHTMMLSGGLLGIYILITAITRQRRRVHLMSSTTT